MINIENSNVFSLSDDANRLGAIEQKEVWMADMHGFAAFED